MLDAAAALRQNVTVPFEEARGMPPEVYTSAAFTRLEEERIFARDWFCVGRADALAAPGDYAALELAGQPVAVIRGHDGALRAVSNVCLHRMSTLLHGRGNATSIVCPYHAWTYGLDGRLRGAPAMERNRAFDKADYRLPALRCEEWLGWVFVTLNAEAEPVAARLAGAEALIDDFDMANYRQSFFEEHVWDTNWKVLAENFMESYHLPVCHAATIGGLSKLEEMVCPEGSPAFNYHWILKDDTLKIALAHPRNTRLKGERRRTTFLLSIYPSLMITITPGYFWYLALQPNGPGQVRIGYGGGLSQDYHEDEDAQAHFRQLKTMLDKVNEEDRGCTEKVYRGLLSGMSRPGHLSHLERPNFEFAQYLDRMVNGGG